MSHPALVRWSTTISKKTKKSIVANRHEAGGFEMLKPLPKLTGSPDQIAWAEDIRPLMIAMVEDDLRAGRFDLAGPFAQIRFRDTEDALGWLRAHAAASWWIRRKNRTTGGLLTHERPDMAPPYRRRPVVNK